MKSINIGLLLLCLLITSGSFGQKTERTKRKLWKKYKTEISNDKNRKEEHTSKSISFNGKTMKYDYTKKGMQPENGFPLYIALHGGGGAPSNVNDSQWEHMKMFYEKSVENGIYLAPRGVSDTWNLHFVDEAYPLYDRLIENMIVFENVDPNRIYITGYSAGGDGVYQIVPKMADRFAAANMSAGHPNGIDLKNVYHVPFLIQMGELDGAYDRNKEAVIYGQKLDELAKKYPNGYKHDVFIHWEKEHSYVKDHSGKHSTSEIIENPTVWLTKPAQKKKTTQSTDAIFWMSQNTRNPLPAHLIWNYQVKADTRNGVTKDGKQFWTTNRRSQLFYWLDAGTKEQSQENKVIDVKIQKDENLIIVNEMGAYLKILLNGEMVDLSEPIRLQIGEEQIEVRVKRDKKLMKQTLWDRGDWSFIFESAIEIKKKNGGIVIQ